MKDTRKSITQFGWFCDCILKGELTPLQRDEIQRARDDHLSVFSQPPSELHKHSDNLERQQETIEDRWN